MGCGASVPSSSDVNIVLQRRELKKKPLPDWSEEVITETVVHQSQHAAQSGCVDMHASLSRKMFNLAHV
jgi:hypothetical protein